MLEVCSQLGDVSRHVIDQRARYRSKIEGR